MAFSSKSRKEVARAARVFDREEAARLEDPAETERKRLAREKAKEKAIEKESRYFSANRRTVAEWEAIGRLPPCIECGAPRQHL